MDVKNLHSRLHLDRSFWPTIKFDCNANYLDVACRTMVAALGYTAHLMAQCAHTTNSPRCIVMGYSRGLGHCHDALRQIALPCIGT
jgi:hypothetical protein